MFRRFLIITTIATTLAGTAAFAQGVKGNRARRAGVSGQLRGRSLERLQQRLNLSESQMNGVRALQETRRTEMQSLRQEMQPKRQALRQLLQQPNPNPTDVGNATLAMKENRERVREINQRFMAGVKGMLTPDQLQQLPKRAR
jgi:Spy/CpxP family protein refolding chaperone